MLAINLPQNVSSKSLSYEIYTSRFLLTGYVQLIYTTVLLWLLQFRVPLRVLCSYGMHGNLATVAPSKVLQFAVTTALLHYMTSL